MPNPKVRRPDYDKAVTGRRAIDKGEQVLTAMDANEKLPGRKLLAATMNDFSSKVTRTPVSRSLKGRR